MTQYSFNLLGDLLTITDGRGSQTQYQYDSLGRQVKAVYADGSFEESVYDEAGNLIQETDRKGQVKRYVHDSLNRLVRAYLPDDTELRSYDAVGRLVRHEKDSGVITYGYNLLGALTQETDTYGNQLTRTYNAVGSETALSVTQNRTGTGSAGFRSNITTVVA